MAGNAGGHRAGGGLGPFRTHAWTNLCHAGAPNPHTLEKSFMTFDRVWMLLFLVLPVAWAIFEWRNTKRHLPLVLKACSLLAIVVALAEPRLAISETKMAVNVLVDTSASTAQDLSRASQVAAGIEKARGRNTAHVLP